MTDCGTWLAGYFNSTVNEAEEPAGSPAPPIGVTLMLKSLEGVTVANGVDVAVGVGLQALRLRNKQTSTITDRRYRIGVTFRVLLFSLHKKAVAAHRFPTALISAV